MTDYHLSCEVITHLMLAGAHADPNKPTLKKLATMIADALTEFKESGMQLQNYLFSIGIDDEQIRDIMADALK